jgi:hypothetical protein
VQSQWGAQSGCWQRPRQLDDVELDGSNKAEAARQVKASSKPPSVPMLGMSFPRLPFLVGTAIPQDVSKKFVENEKWDCKKQLTKMKFHFIGHLRTSSETCLQQMF